MCECRGCVLGKVAHIDSEEMNMVKLAVCLSVCCGSITTDTHVELGAVLELAATVAMVGTSELWHELVFFINKSSCLESLLGRNQKKSRLELGEHFFVI